MKSASKDSIDVARRMLIEHLLHDHPKLLAVGTFVRLAAAVPDDAAHASQLSSMRAFVDSSWQDLLRVLQEIPGD